MKKLQWWFRIVGLWYLLLGIMNIYMMFLGSEQTILDTLPFPADEWALRAFVDGWSPFLFEMLGIATFALWVSRSPGKFIGAGLLIVWLEFVHGVLDDIYLIARGYDAASYIGFIVVHLAIIGTGIWAARAAQSDGSVPVALLTVGD